MGGEMSVIIGRYTEAEFAAALLHCGPHDHHVCDQSAEGHGDFDGYSCPINRRYYGRVYKYFIKVSHITPSRTAGEWATFWSEYIRWVES